MQINHSTCQYSCPMYLCFVVQFRVAQPACSVGRENLERAEFTTLTHFSSSYPSKRPQTVYFASMESLQKISLICRRSPGHGRSPYSNSKKSLHTRTLYDKISQVSAGHPGVCTRLLCDLYEREINLQITFSTKSLN